MIENVEDKKGNYEQKFEFIQKGKVKKKRSNNHTEIVCIIDRSGSMASIKDDAIGGFNTFLDEQKKLEGTATVSLVLFDNQYEEVYNNENLTEVENLTEETFIPRGGTALLDAIGKTINALDNRLITEKSEIPPKVMICILTDGKENRSEEFSKDQIKKLIENKRQKRWEFCFLAANQDAFGEAGSMGISSNQTISFASTGQGTRSAYTSMSRLVGDYRSSKENE